jgi:hypothetical protein
MRTRILLLAVLVSLPMLAQRQRVARPAQLRDDGTTVTLPPGRNLAIGTTVPPGAPAGSAAVKGNLYSGSATTPYPVPRVLYGAWANTAANMISTDGGVYNTLTATNGCPAGVCAATAAEMAWTIPANLLTAGKILRITYTLLYTSSGGAPSVTITTRLGATTVASGSFGAAGSAISNTQTAYSVLLVGTDAPGAAVLVDAAILNGATWSNRSTIAPAAIATNASQAISIAIAFSAATAGNMVQVRSMVVEELN